MTKSMYVTEVLSEFQVGYFLLDRDINRSILNDILNTYCSFPCNTNLEFGEFEGDTYESCTDQLIDLGLFYEDYDLGDSPLGLHWSSGLDEDVSEAVENYISNTSDSERKEFADRRKSFLTCCSQSVVEIDVTDFTNLDKQNRRL